MLSTTQRRLLMPVTVASVAGFVLAGCSTGGDNQGTGATGDLDGASLTIAADWTGAEQENFQKVLDAFANDTGAKVTYTSYGSDVATTLETKITGGDPPDLAVIPQPGLLKKLAQDGSLIELSDDTLNTVKENFSQDWVDLGTVDGKTYGIWFKGSNQSTVWYNTKVYDDAGATEPETWEDFVAALKTVSDSGTPGLSVGADVGWPLTDWFENVYLRTAGQDKYDQLSNHEIPWTDQSVIDALTVLSGLWSDSSLLDPGGAQRTFGDSVTQVFGDPPKAGTVYEGDFVAGNIAADTTASVGTDAKFFDFPSIDGSDPSVVGGGNAAIQLTDKKGAAELMTYLASPEAATIWVKLGGFTSPNKAVNVADYPDDTSRQIAEAVVGAKIFRFDMSDLAPSAFGGTKGAGEWQIMLDFYTNPTDVQGTAQKLEAAAKTAFGN